VYFKAGASFGYVSSFSSRKAGVELKSHRHSNYLVGVGYYLMDNTRLDSSYYYYPGAKLTSYRIKTVNLTHKALIDNGMVSIYYDFLDFGVAKIFTGVGIGCVRIKEKIHVQEQSKAPINLIGKPVMNISTALFLGSSTELIPGLLGEAGLMLYDFNKSKSLKSSGLEFGKNRYRGADFNFTLRYEL
jgi:opacity protein-like surface antigen